MKKTIVLLLILVNLTAFGQKVEVYRIGNTETYIIEYQNKFNAIVSGDTLTIEPSKIKYLRIGDKVYKIDLLLTEQKPNYPYCKNIIQPSFTPNTYVNKK